MSIEEYNTYLDDLSPMDLFKELMILRKINKLNKDKFNTKEIKNIVNNIIGIKKELAV